MNTNGTPGNIRLTGTITIPQARMAELLPLLDQHISLTRAEPGCIYFEVTQDPDTPEIFHVSELFTDEAAFAAHQANGAARPWGPASAGLTRDFHKVTV